MPALTPFTQEEIDTWALEELGTDGTSPSMNLDQNGSMATRSYLCHWSKRYDVIKYFLGDQDTYFDSGVMKITRLTPRKLPGRPEFVVVQIREVSGHAWRDFAPGNPDYEASYPDFPSDPPLEGEQTNAWGGTLREYQFTDDTINVFQCAKITVLYQIVPYEVREDQFVADESERFAQYVPGASDVQYLTIPTSTQQYITQDGSWPNGVPVPYPVGLTEAIYRFEIILWRWPLNAWGPGSVLYSRVFGNESSTPYLNSVNKSTFWEGSFVRGTVLFEGVEDTLDLSSLEFSQKYCWKIRLKFAVNPKGWLSQYAFPNTAEFGVAGNQVKRALVGRGSTWYDDADIPDGYSQFNVREFSNLFNPGTL